MSIKKTKKKTPNKKKLLILVRPRDGCLTLSKIVNITFNNISNIKERNM
jgi:hypothetical protein